MRSRHTQRLGGALGAAFLVIGLIAAPSHAARTVVAQVDIAWAPIFYDNIVTGDGENTLILYTGATVEEECADDLGTTPGQLRTKGDPPSEGSKTVESLVTRAPFYVYEGGGLDAVEFGSAVCDSLSSGGPAPDPVATGHGLVRQRTLFVFHGESTPPDGTIVNSAVGVVRTTDGRRWAVRGDATLTLSPEFSVDHVAFTIRQRR